MNHQHPEPRPNVSAGVRLAELDELELRIEQLVAGGDGLGRFEGIPIFVPCAAPGDLLRVRLEERRQDYGRAVICEILQPGPGRRTPPCPFFTHCGGCDLQHLEDELQVRLKAQAVHETLRRLGDLEIPAEVPVIVGQPWAYRLRTQLHVGSGDRGVLVGYFARGSQRLVPVDRCPILVPELERALPDLPRQLEGQSHRRLDLAVGDGGAWTTAPVVPELPHGEVSLQVGKFNYSYDARCFFQGNRSLVGALAAHAVADFTGELAVELYAGVGLFTLPLAERYRQVVAVEGERVAARFARNNLRRNRVNNVQLTAQAVDTWIAELPVSVARMVVDPPRGGLSLKVRRALLERPPQRLTYVSCHAATLARDLKQLQRGFALEGLTLLDLFPQTGHMEAVVQLIRRGGA